MKIATQTIFTQFYVPWVEEGVKLGELLIKSARGTRMSPRTT